MTARPAAGIVGVVSHPLHGAYLTVAKRFATKPVQVQRATRIEDGLHDVQNAQSNEGALVLDAFKEAMKEGAVKARQEKYAKAAKDVLEEACVEEAREGKASGEGTSASSPSSSSASTSASRPASPVTPITELEARGFDEAMEAIGDGRYGVITEEDKEQLRRDIDAAIQLSLRQSISSVDAKTSQVAKGKRNDDAGGAMDEDEEFLRDLERAKELSLHD